jgi:hypothetical protein
MAKSPMYLIQLEDNEQLLLNREKEIAMNTNLVARIACLAFTGVGLFFNTTNREAAILMESVGPALYAISAIDLVAQKRKYTFDGT